MRLADYMVVAARTFGVTVPAMLSLCKNQDILDARRAVILIGRDNLGMTYPQIARIMNRDHSSIISAYRRGQERLVDRDFADKFDLITETRFQHIGDVAERMFGGARV